MCSINILLKSSNAKRERPLRYALDNAVEKERLYSNDESRDLQQSESFREPMCQGMLSAS